MCFKQRNYAEILNKYITKVHNWYTMGLQYRYDDYKWFKCELISSIELDAKYKNIYKLMNTYYKRELGILSVVYSVYTKKYCYPQPNINDFFKFYGMTETRLLEYLIQTDSIKREIKKYCNDIANYWTIFYTNEYNIQSIEINEKTSKTYKYSVVGGLFK